MKTGFAVFHIVDLVQMAVGHPTVVLPFLALVVAVVWLIERYWPDVG